MSAPNNFEASASWLHFDGAVVSMVLHAGGASGRQAKENRVSFRNLLLASVIFWTCPLECFTHVPKINRLPEWLWGATQDLVESSPTKVRGFEPHSGYMGNTMVFGLFFHLSDIHTTTWTSPA